MLGSIRIHCAVASRSLDSRGLPTKDRSCHEFSWWHPIRGLAKSPRPDRLKKISTTTLADTCVNVVQRTSCHGMRIAFIATFGSFRRSGMSGGMMEPGKMDGGAMDKGKMEGTPK